MCICFIKDFTHISGINSMLLSALEENKIERGIENVCMCLLEKLQVKNG